MLRRRDAWESDEIPEELETVIGTVRDKVAAGDVVDAPEEVGQAYARYAEADTDAGWEHIHFGRYHGVPENTEPVQVDLYVVVDEEDNVLMHDWNEREDWTGSYSSLPARMYERVKERWYELRPGKELTPYEEDVVAVSDEAYEHLADAVAASDIGTVRDRAEVEEHVEDWRATA